MIALAHTSKNPLPSLVFVHGMCHGGWCWNQGFMQYFFEKGYNCYAIDLPGHEHPGRYTNINSYGIDDYVQYVFNVVKSTGQNPILMGHSMGAFVVQKYLEQYECNKAVLLASVPPKGILPAALRYIVKHPEGIVHLLKRDIYEPFVKHANDLYSDNFGTTEIEKYRHHMCAESFKALVNMMFKPLRKPVKKRVPVYVFGGKEDNVISINEIKQTAAFHETEATIIEGIGHNMMLDFHWKKTAEHILHSIQE